MRWNAFKSGFLQFKHQPFSIWLSIQKKASLLALANILEICRIPHTYRRIPPDSMVHLWVMCSNALCDCWHHHFCHSSLFLVSNVLRSLQVSAGILIAWLVDCSQSPISPWDRPHIARLTVNGSHLDFQMYRGGERRGLKLEGEGRAIFLASSQTVSRPLSRFDSHLRWPPVTQSFRSRRSYGKIGDSEQSTWLGGGGSSTGASWCDRIYWSSLQPRIN